MAEEPPPPPPEKTESAILYKKEPRTRKDYGISKIQVMPGLSANYSDGYEEPLKYSPFIPALSEDSGTDYVPMTYTFRIPQFDLSKKVKNLCAKSPPFYVLLDHTLAVIWIIVSGEKPVCPFGLCHVQWAYYFLKTVRKRSGGYSADVAILLDYMVKILRKGYAQLDTEFKNIDEANEKIRTFDVFGAPEDVLKNTVSMNYEEMQERAKEVLEKENTDKEPPLPEEELKQKIDSLIEEMEDFEGMDQEKREQLIKDFIKYKDQIQKRCDEHMETLMAIQVIMKEVSPELFDENDELKMLCKD